MRQLQRLLVTSRSNILYCIRKITQQNSGRKTADVNKMKYLDARARVELYSQLLGLDLRDWDAPPVFRTYIPKPNGNLRPLGILTIKDRVIQLMVKKALEPEWEAKFEGCSYKPRRSVDDCMYAPHLQHCCS